ncbi:MAG: hypothetical protein IKY47_05270, partial [Bacteroidaceae bacterium]|nr:hypothetical protein [Bacteroidaceae bacterium]
MLFLFVGMAWGATGDVLSLENGWYSFKANNSSRYALYNGNDRIIIKETTGMPLLTKELTYYVTNGEGNKFTLQTSDGRFVTYKGTGTGDQVAVVDAANANDGNKWWQVREGNAANLRTIVPSTSATNGWNFAVNYNGANGALGFWGAGDGGSQWIVEQTAIPEGKVRINCQGYYLRVNDENIVKANGKDDATVFTVSRNTDGYYSFQTPEDQYITYTSTDKGANIALAANGNKWWSIAMNVGAGAGFDVFPADATFANNVPAFNWAKSVTGANTGLGTWDANDNNSYCTFELETYEYSCKYFYNGDLKATQTGRASVGDLLPDASAVLPYGVKVNSTDVFFTSNDFANGELVKDIEVVDNLPFKCAASYDAITNWYNIHMHSSYGYGQYLQYAGDYIEWLDKEITAGEEASYIWSFVGNPYDGIKLVSYVAPVAANAVLSNNGEGNVSFASLENATAWEVKPSAVNKDFEHFCFKYPNGKYMNAQSGKVAHWGDADQGSTMWLDEVTELPELPDAVVGNVFYTSFTDALAAAEAGQTINMLKDVTTSDIITINKAITLDGNGKKLTSTAARAINIETESKVVINNLTVNAAERAFNIINKPATVELNGVTATASNNAVMIATSAGAAKVTIDGCDLTGLAVVNVAGAESQVDIKNSTITNVDATPDENYGAITVWTSAEEAVVNVENTTITVADDSKMAYVFPANATVNGVDEVGYIVVTVGDAGYDTLTEAVEKAKAGETIEFVRDVTAFEIITINKAITLDGNGHTLTYTGSGASARAIDVKSESNGANLTVKNLTIDCTASYCQRGINYNTTGALVLDNVTVKGTNVTYALNLPGSSVGANVTINKSNLTANIALNVWGKEAVINATDSHFTSVDNSTAENYSAVALNNDGTTAA